VEFGHFVVLDLCKSFPAEKIGKFTIVPEMKESSIFERHVIGFGELVICHYQKQIPFPLVLDVGNKLEGVDDLFVVQKGAVEFSASGKACGVCLLAQRFHIDDLPLKECSNSKKQDQIKISFQGCLYLHQVNVKLGKMPLHYHRSIKPPFRDEDNWKSPILPRKSTPNSRAVYILALEIPLFFWLAESLWPIRRERPTYSSSSIHRYLHDGSDRKVDPER